MTDGGGGYSTNFTQSEPGGGGEMGNDGGDSGGTEEPRARSDGLLAQLGSG